MNGHSNRFRDGLVTQTIPIQVKPRTSAGMIRKKMLLSAGIFKPGEHKPGAAGGHLGYHVGRDCLIMK